MDVAEIFIAISLGLSFFLLYTRRKKWSTDKLRWLITGIVFLCGLLGLLNDKKHLYIHGFHFLLTPLIYNCFDRWFKHLSIRKYGRDFYLWLRGSDDIDDGFRDKNPHLKPLDRFFSLLLLFIIIGLMAFAASLQHSINN